MIKRLLATITALGLGTSAVYAQTTTGSTQQTVQDILAFLVTNQGV